MENIEVRGRFSLVRDAINKTYNIYDLLVDYVPNLSRFTTSCHSIFNSADINPSMRIDLGKNIWNDFSSGFKGTYLELRWRIATELKHEEITLYSLANKILQGDPRLKEAVGFSSIFKVEHVISEPLNVARARPTRSKMDTFDTILNQLNQREDKYLLISFISDFQLGMLERELVPRYKELFKTSTGTVKSVKDEIEAILRGE